MIIIVFFAFFTTLFAGWRLWRRLRYFLHIFQLEGYKLGEFVSWIQDRADRILFRLSHKLALAELALGFFGFFYWSPFWTAVLLLPLWSITFASSRLYRSDQQKKPLKYTNRLQRLLAAAGFLAILPVIAGFITWTSSGLEYLFYFLLGFFAADLLAPLWVVLAASLLRPVESSIQEGFKRRARRRLSARTDLKIVGITGSYGKTSTKFIIDEILRQRYNVLTSPGSYNTPMGLCIVINELMRPEHQVLVLEMGIRHHGDMQELCKIIQPDAAVVTSVGIAHLETMGTIEEIAHEKGQILTCMKSDGIAVLNADDPRVNSMDTSAAGRVWKVSAKGSAVADITARNISYGPEGAQFTVRDDTGDERVFKTRLLGEHNVLNILLGVAVGRALNVRLRQIAYAVERLAPIEHRLQLRQQGHITVIDDAFNSNPVGAQNALEILGQFNTGRRIVVTPGMIELGEHQYEENKRLGEHIADHVDLALLVGGEQTRPIQDGLKAKKFPAEKWKVVDSFFEAQDFLKTFLKAGDIVLYENDLPDQYNE